MPTPPDVKQNIRTFLSHLIGDTDRTLEQNRPIQHHHLPVDMPMERDILRIIYGCKVQGVPPSAQQVIESLSLHVSQQEAQQAVFQLMQLRTDDRSVRNMSAAINMYFDEQRQRQAFVRAAEIMESPVGTPEENYERAVAEIMRASPKRENGSQFTGLQRFTDFLRAQGAVDERRAAGRPVGLRPPFTSLQRLIPTLEAGDMMLVTGQTGFGKTTFGTFLAEQFAWETKVPTLYCHLETTPLSLQRRQIARYCLIPTGLLRSGDVSPTDPRYWTDVFHPFQEMLGRNEREGNILETLYCPGWNDKQITTAAALFVRRAHDRGQDAAVIVDYIQKVEHPGATDERIRIERAAEKFKDFAGEEECHITILSQEAPGKSGEDSSPFGSQGPKQYSQVHLAIERQRAEWDWRITRSGVDVVDNCKPGRTRYWHKRGQWDARVKVHVVKANDDELGTVHSMWENQFFRIQEADESIWSVSG